MSNAVQQEEGAARFTVILSKELKAKVEGFHDTYKISQGAVIEVLLENMDMNVLGKHFEARQHNKVSKRGSKRQIIEKMKGMTPDQLAAIEAHIASLAAKKE